MLRPTISIQNTICFYHFIELREKKVSMEVFQRCPAFHLDEYPAEIPVFNRRVNKSGKQLRTRGASVNTPLRL